MSIVSAALTDVSNGPIYRASKGKNFSFAVTGSFTAGWELVKLTPDRSSVERVVVSGTSTQSAMTIIPGEDANYRFRVVDHDSGTVTGVMTDLNDNISRVENNEGVAVFDVNEDGIDSPQISIGGTAITASAAELNRIADVSGRIVSSTDAGTLALTVSEHEGRIVDFNDADGGITLPAATGSGGRFSVRCGTAFTGGTITVAADTDDEFEGLIIAVDTDDDSTLNYPALAGDDFDTITLSGATTGGNVGDFLEFIDVADGVWRVFGTITQSGGSEATPLSDGSITAP